MNFINLSWSGYDKELEEITRYFFLIALFPIIITIQLIAYTVNSSFILMYLYIKIHTIKQ